MKVMRSAELRIVYVTYSLKQERFLSALLPGSWVDPLSAPMRSVILGSWRGFLLIARITLFTFTYINVMINA